MSWEHAKGSLERIANEQKYGHPAGLVGKAMADLEAERVKREEAARDEVRLAQSVASAEVTLEAERGRVLARAKLAADEIQRVWSRLDDYCINTSSNWRAADAVIECPHCCTKVPRRATVSKRARWCDACG